jgi:hypothetical protein
MLKKYKGQQLSSLPQRQNILKYGRIRISCLLKTLGYFTTCQRTLNYINKNKVMNKRGEARIRTSFLCAS